MLQFDSHRTHRIERAAVVIGALLVAACTGAADAGSGGTVTLALDGVEGYSGMVVAAWVLPSQPEREKQALGGAEIGVIDSDPFSGSEPLHPQDPDRYWAFARDQVAIIEPGTHRLAIEAYVPSGPMKYGCEMRLVVPARRSVVVTVTALPEYTENGFHWTSDSDLHYPECWDHVTAVPIRP